MLLIHWEMIGGLLCIIVIFHRCTRFLVEQSWHPTSTILDIWGKQPDSTSTNLRSILTQMGRYDMVGLFNQQPSPAAQPSSQAEQIKPRIPNWDTVKEEFTSDSKTIGSIY